jgi:SAM-dependent methyltransferase
MMTSFEQTYYENPGLWTPERFDRSESERVRLTIDAIPPETTCVLDLGCGNGVLTNQLYDKFTVGIDRSLSALKWVSVPCCKSDIASLPFNDNSFDVVITTEVLEHLPHRVFTDTLAEIVRVTRRYILITVPYCEDRDLSKASCPICSCQFHVNYHMRSFYPSDIERLFSDYKSISLVCAKGIFAVKSLWFSKELKVLYRKVAGVNTDLPWYAICPQCGYSPSESLRSYKIDRQKKNNPFWFLVRSFWPKKRVYKWWLSLYRKDKALSVENV